jgi:molecular chaperone HtpG
MRRSAPPEVRVERGQRRGVDVEGSDGVVVRDVRVSKRLTDSPACLVLGEHDVALHMQHLLKQAGHALPESRPTLEINPEHPLLRRMSGLSDEARFSDWSTLLFDQAVLAEGGQLEDPSAFVQRMNALLTELPVEEVPEGEDAAAESGEGTASEKE